MRRLAIFMLLGVAGCMNLTPPEELGMDPALIERCKPSQEEKIVNFVIPLVTALGRQAVMSDECLQFRRDWAMLDAEANQKAARHESFPQNTPSLGDFTDEVLAPLSRQLADDIIAHEKALLIAGAKGQNQLFSDSDMARDTQLQQELALLEPKRLPLQREIRDLLVKRTKTTSGGFSICLENSERIYKPRFSGAGYTRVSDSPAACEKFELQQLKTTVSF